MSRTDLAAIALACVAALAPAARANDAAVKAELDRLNDKLIDATRRKDTRALMALMTPDFQMKKTTGGWVNRARTEALLRKSWPAIAGFRSWRTDIRNLKTSGNTATAIVEDYVVADMKDSKGGIHVVTMQTIARQEWRRTDGAWRFRRMEDLKAKNTTAGPVYVPAKQALRVSRKAVPRPKAGPKPGISEANARLLLEKAYAASRKAFRAKDVAGVMATATKDYTVEYPARTSSRWQVERDLRKDLKSTKAIKSWTAKIGAITVAGDSFTANITESKTSIILDGNGKPHTSEVVDTLKDVWVKTPSGWRNRKTIVVAATVKLDGRLQAE
ncbi:MAG TPA: nuclear transport factor 2 family protein [Armatimonadota bacterium]|jgi:ketosteroid isomerase-like protein